MKKQTCKTIGGEEYLNKFGVMEQEGICERTFFNKLKVCEGKLHRDDMIKKHGSWYIKTNSVKSVFGRDRRPKQNDIIEKWEKYMLGIKWDIFGNISPSKMSKRDNIELIKHFFNQLTDTYTSRSIKMISFIENNNQQDNNNEFYHTHFLMKTNLTKDEKSEIRKGILYNQFPNYQFIDYDYDKYKNTGVLYTIKQTGEHIFLETRK
jgi:hypothetical protein